MAKMIGACGRYVSSKLRRDEIDWNAIDHLANVLTAIEYVIESVSIKASERERLLERATKDLEKLGYRLSALEGLASDSDAEAKIEFETTEIETVSSDVPEEAPRHEVDEEILEIFIEEVDEVLQTIDTHFEVWRTDYSNRTALTEFRRSFHPLKGSGRMVGADILGELAWAV